MTNSFDSISSYSDAIRAGNARPSDLVGACCSLIKEKDSRLGAFQEVFLDDAITFSVKHCPLEREVAR